MTDLTGTPQPWRYQEESDAYTHIVRGPSNQHICQFAQDTSGRAEKDARFVAGAANTISRLSERVATLEGALPKLIEDAEELRHWLECDTRELAKDRLLDGNDIDRVIEKADVVIEGLRAALAATPAPPIQGGLRALQGLAYGERPAPPTSITLDMLMPPTKSEPDTPA